MPLQHRTKCRRSDRRDNRTNWTQGNDDQGFWGLAAMHAAEMKLPDVQTKGAFSWVSLAQGVFNTQKERWDTTACGGGLRWQLQPYQGGYTMKNSVSNGVFFQIAARLYRYTGDQLYKTWAEKIWDWSQESPLLNNQTWHVADSTEMANNCADSGDYQWTYNYGTYMMGAAYMYNYVSGALSDRIRISIEPNTNGNDPADRRREVEAPGYWPDELDFQQLLPGGEQLHHGGGYLRAQGQLQL